MAEGAERANDADAIREYAEHFGCDYYAGKRPWGVPAEIAMPCATQNEIGSDHAQTLVDNGRSGGRRRRQHAVHGRGRKAVSEQPRAIRAGPKRQTPAGVAVSGWKQSQNALRISWPRQEVDERLRNIMRDIHDKCRAEGTDDSGFVNYVRGANIAGFRKVADAMLAYGVV